MNFPPRYIVVAIVGIALLLALLVLFHLGGVAWQFSQLTGAIIGGILALFSAWSHIRHDENVEGWVEYEQVSWMLVGCGLLMWAFGESVWRYYVLTHQSPFPSPADIGYASLPPLVFAGLLLQPSSDVRRGKLLVFFDSLIAMGAMLTIGWYLLLGPLALASNENTLAKFLGLYYPTTDIALLSSVVILLIRGQGALYQSTARRVNLFVMGLGLCFFATSDFIFNLQQNAGSYVDGTWVDLGWPFGMMTIGLAVYLRRFLPRTPMDVIKRRLHGRSGHVAFGPAQLAIYALVAILFFILCLNVFSSDKQQLLLRPVLLLGTVGVIGLVVVRQILTLLDNELLAKRQEDALRQLEIANQQVEGQARAITQRNADLEAGILHLKEVLARLANGNLRARAHLSSGELMSLAVGINLMAERMSHMEHSDSRLKRLSRCLYDLSLALGRYKSGKPLVLPPGYNELSEINQLLLALGLKEKAIFNRADSMYGAPDASVQMQAHKSEKLRPSSKPMYTSPSPIYLSREYWLQED
jgi:hypothetical protein